MATPPESVEIYCLKCRTKTVSRDVEQVTMKNGRPAPACCLLCVRHRQIPNRLRRLNLGLRRRKFCPFRASREFRRSAGVEKSGGGGGQLDWSAPQS